MKVLFVFCEGMHDAQFVGRVLKDSSDFVDYNKSLKEYPHPLADFIQQQYKAANPGEMVLGKSG